MAVAMRGDTIPPIYPVSLHSKELDCRGLTPYSPCMKPRMTVPFSKLTIHEFDVARNIAMPVPVNQNATTITGNGGAQVIAV